MGAMANILLKRDPSEYIPGHKLRICQLVPAPDLIDEFEFVVLPRLAGHGPTLFAGLSAYVDLKLVDRLEFGEGAVVLRYEPRR